MGGCCVIASFSHNTKVCTNTCTHAQHTHTHTHKHTHTHTQSYYEQAMERCKQEAIQDETYYNGLAVTTRYNLGRLHETLSEFEAAENYYKIILKARDLLICLYIHLLFHIFSVCLSVCLFVCLSVCLSS